jgi:hypothetical protein
MQKFAAFWKLQKGTALQLIHPEMCQDSMYSRLCTNLDCMYFHVKGTKRYEYEIRNAMEVNNSQYNSSNRNNRRSNSYERDYEDFHTRNMVYEENFPQLPVPSQTIRENNIQESRSAHTNSFSFNQVIPKKTLIPSKTNDGVSFLDQTQDNQIIHIMKRITEIEESRREEKALLTEILTTLKSKSATPASYYQTPYHKNIEINQVPVQY